MKVLIVDDEPDVRTLVRNALSLGKEELTPLEAGDGDEAMNAIRTNSPDLVVLDLMLPGRDGFQVLQDIRRVSDVPVIVLTARGLEGDKIRGLELGADDYVTKPFSPRELVARIDSVIRRAMAHVQRAGTIERGELQVDLAARRVRRGGTEVHFTPTEFNLLAELATHPGETLTHEALLRRVWGPEYSRETHYLKVYVNRLRDKVEADPAEPKLIQTVRGVGYRFAEAEGSN